MHQTERSAKVDGPEIKTSSFEQRAKLDLFPSERTHFDANNSPVWPMTARASYFA